eukprot:10920427-Lingulodinium_polyedra.AAC.1
MVAFGGTGTHREASSINPGVSCTEERACAASVRVLPLCNPGLQPQCAMAPARATLHSRCPK